MKNHSTHRSLCWSVAIACCFSLIVGLNGHSAASSQPFILSPKSPQSMEGIFSVAVAIPVGMRDRDSVHIKLDSEDFGSSGIDNFQNGVRILYFPIHTYYYSNGAHIIYCYHGHDVVDMCKISFKNTFSHLVYDAVFNTRTMSEAKVKATAQSHTNWIVRIEDLNGNVVRTFYGHGTKINVQWDGRDDNNSTASDGNYQLTLTKPKAKASLTSPIMKVTVG